MRCSGQSASAYPRYRMRQKCLERCGDVHLMSFQQKNQTNASLLRHVTSHVIGRMWSFLVGTARSTRWIQSARYSVAGWRAVCKLSFGEQKRLITGLVRRTVCLKPVNCTIVRRTVQGSVAARYTTNCVVSLSSLSPFYPRKSYSGVFSSF